MFNIYTGSGILVGFLILAFFAGTILFLIASIVVAPGVLITTLLFNLLSKPLVSGDLWTSSAVFSVLIIIAMRFLFPLHYKKYYICSILVIALFMGFYNTYVNHSNMVMTTVNAMYSSENVGKPIEDTSTAATIKGTNINLRQAPSQAAPIVTTLQNGEKVLIKKQVSEWFFVCTGNGTEGWVFGSYVAK
ncbi:MAG: Bacterial domain [Firmicutes bacterium]|nr:Bacterial domain [Bacillota bacterium]